MKDKTKEEEEIRDERQDQRRRGDRTEDGRQKKIREKT